MSWFIESWMPLAGHAFAVHRNYTYAGLAQKQRDERLWLEADEIHLVAPPDFTPVPCAGEATALWATRGPFQHKFLQDDGAEFAFESLAQLIELVRRIYLASGMGPPPSVDVPRPPLPDVPPALAQWGEVLRALNDRDASTFDAATPNTPRPPDPALIARAARAIVATLDVMGQGLRELSLSTLVSLALERATGRGPSRREAQAWAVLVAEMNDWQQDWWAAANSTATALGSAPARPLPTCWPFGMSGALEDALLEGLLHRVPSSHVNLPYLKFPVQIGYLGDHLSLAMADPRYVRALPTAREALPLLTAALGLAAAASWDFRSGVLDDGFRLVRMRAAHWLAEELPNARVTIPGADLVIGQFLQRRAGGKP